MNGETPVTQKELLKQQVELQQLIFDLVSEVKQSLAEIGADVAVLKAQSDHEEAVSLAKGNHNVWYVGILSSSVLSVAALVVSLVR